MFTNALARETVSILRNVLPPNQSILTFREGAMDFENSVVRFQELNDADTMNLMVRFDKAAKMGSEITSKLGLTEEQIIKFCLEVE